MNLPLFDVGPVHADLSQWFTPPEIADRLVRWCGDIPKRRVLEPSAGTGRLVDALRYWSSHAHVDAFEVHASTASALAARYDGDPRITIHATDYLRAAPPAELYDLALMNPPYEGGLDGKFLSKAMDESRRVVALVRLAAIAGQERHTLVWSRIERGEWHLASLAIFTKRPEFDPGVAIGEREGYGAKADFAAVKLTREPCRTAVEWWS